jgi:hypothetical protein
MDEIAAAVGCPLPRELRELLERDERVEGAGVEVDLTGREMNYEDRDLFPCGHPIAADGAGNFWVVDVTPAAIDVAPVFYASHDPPMIVFASDDLAGFLEQVRAGDAEPALELSAGVDRAGALAAGGELAVFAQELDDRFVFFDLRNPSRGEGFEWGRFGPRTEVRRHGYERLFALAPPERKPGRLSRLFRS